MGNLIAYSGLTTKIRAMQSNLISKSEYEEIANLNSVPELFAYLQQHKGYSHLLANIDASTAHRGDIESLLRFSTFRDFTKIYNFANAKQRKYLDLYFMTYEIAVLKRYIRNIFDSRDDSSLTVLKNDFEIHSKIDTKKVSESSTIEEFVNNLKGTPYYEPLWKLNSLEHLALFDYEMCLDLYFFSTLWKSKNKYFKGEELDIITRSYGYKIDMLNIMWIYRSKKYYNISSSQIHTLLIPIYYKIKHSEITALVETETLDQFFAALKYTYYNKYINFNTDHITLEELQETLLYILHVRDYKKNPYSIATINTYLYLKEKEIRNITTATECIRYGYSAEDIIKQLS